MMFASSQPQRRQSPSPVTRSAVGGGYSALLERARGLRRPAIRSKIFLSYHYGWDADRAELIRAFLGSSCMPKLADDAWNQLLQEGDHAVVRWIAEQLDRSQSTVVLISSSTRGRRVIDHEICSAWKCKRGVLGIHVHNLPDRNGNTTPRGANPFAEFEMTRDRSRLSDIVRVYDPPYTEPASVLLYIAENLPDWLNEAVRIRRNY